MMRLVSCVCALAVLGVCVAGMSTKRPAKSLSGAGTITVFLTGNELGTLKACGCTEGQLGGFERRPAIFNSVPASQRLIIDTGSFVRGNSEQDLIKFNIIIQAFGLLGYDLVNLTEEDIKIARELGVLDSLASVFGIISPHGTGANEESAGTPAGFTKQLSLAGKPVLFAVATFDAKSGEVDQIAALFGPQSSEETVNILILNHCDSEIIASIAKAGADVDCVICPGESDEPTVISDPDKRPLVISVGRLGRYIGQLKIRADKEKAKLKLSFSATAVTEDLPAENSLVELYKDYQELVKEANLLQKLPRVPLPNGLEYVGSNSCKLCHRYEYEKWGSRAHARAYATLEKVGSQYDPECIVCHVVGMGYDSGYICETKTGHLKDVGCENCHGPGSKHNATLGKAKTTEPKMHCSDCHTPEYSGLFLGDKACYLEKIVHWREPNEPGNVKE